MSIKMKLYFKSMLVFIILIIFSHILFITHKNEYTISEFGSIQNPQGISMKVNPKDITKDTKMPSVTITNETNSALIFSENIILERYENSKWVFIANIYNKKEFAVHLEPGSSYEWDILLESIDPIKVETFNQGSRVVLSEGDYRFVMVIYSTEKILIASSFTVN